VVEGARAVLSSEVRQEVHHAGVHSQPLTPSRSPVADTEVEPGAERLGGIFTIAKQADSRLGQNQREVSLQPILKTPSPVCYRVFPWSEVYPYRTVSDLYREDACLVGELVECTAALQVESGVVPVAGQDAVPNRPPVQGKPHVGAAVVHGMCLATVGKARQRTTSDVDGEAACGVYIV
jgi:hypothetical protein